MRFVAWFQIVIGVVVAGLWTLLLVTGQVPEVHQGRIDIWFHIAAELVMASLLLAAGAAVLRRAQRAAVLSSLALGWLGYSTGNSPGYYAESGHWAVVGMFLLVAAGACGSFAVLWKRDVGTASPTLDECETQAHISPVGATPGGSS